MAGQVWIWEFIWTSNYSPKKKRWTEKLNSSVNTWKTHSMYFFLLNSLLKKGFQVMLLKGWTQTKMQSWNRLNHTVWMLRDTSSHLVHYLGAMEKGVSNEKNIMDSKGKIQFLNSGLWFNSWVDQGFCSQNPKLFTSLSVNHWAFRYSVSF